MNFGMIILNQNIKTMLNYGIWIQVVLLFALKLKIGTKILHMFKNGLAHQTIIQEQNHIKGTTKI